MRALIFNSGLGSRLGGLTRERPKCMVRLGNGESIFHRQLRILSACGVDEFVVTTGPFPDQLERETRPFAEAGSTFRFVRNPIYEKTNYIYSLYLARGFLRGCCCLMLHGDLVFDADYAQAVIDSGAPSLGSVCNSLVQPEKDFKARIVDGKIREVSVNAFGEDCVAFQPFYKLSEDTLKVWLGAVERFVEEGETGVYAENAANTVFEDMDVDAFEYSGHFVEEVDTPEDLERVSRQIAPFDYAQQPVFALDGPDAELADGSACGRLRSARSVAEVLDAAGAARPLVVATSRFGEMGVARDLDAAGIGYGTFTEFGPNPSGEDVARALEAFRAGGHDSLLSVGGGSAIDVAKCVKQLAAMPDSAQVAELESGGLPYSDTVHIAVPTTAGTGSESTHFAVCYLDGRKVSVANACLQPDIAVLDPSTLRTLPEYQKKCTMLDALCQAIESHWSRRSSDASREYSSEAIGSIMESAGGYLAGDRDASKAVMAAANRAGKAINLTTTTAPHAMSYRITSMFGIPHGHAVAMCMPHCWRELIERGDGVLQKRLAEIAALMTGERRAGPADGLAAFDRLISDLRMERTVAGTRGDAEALACSVNVQRLSNFPISLSRDSLEDMYLRIVAWSS